VTIQIGFLTFRMYGLMLMLGAIAGTLVAAMEARRRGLPASYAVDALPWALIGGVIGARLWHVLTPSLSLKMYYGVTTEYYLTHPWEILAVWKGGLGLPGAVLGGAVGLYLYARRNRLSFPLLMDIAAPGLALGQAIGRWGNYFNQELYGKPTDLPWKLYIAPEHRIPGYEQVAYYHPLFLYESLWNLMNMALLLYIGRRWEKRLLPGDLFLIYMIVYAVGRFGLEFLRLDYSPVFGININQLVMVLVILGSGFTLWWRHRRPKESQTSGRLPRPRTKRRRKK